MMAGLTKYLLALLFSTLAYAQSYNSWTGSNFYFAGDLNPSVEAINAPQGTVFFESSGNVYIKTDYGLSTNWTCVTCGGGGGGVSSVGLTLPNVFSVSGSPVTASGTLAGSFISQSPNLVFAGPASGSGLPTFRSLVFSDLPSLSYVSSVSVNSPLSSTGGLTPTVSISQAGPSSNGYLSETDWNTFNGKMDNPSFNVGQTVYVAVGGNDSTGDGSIGNPFQTVSKAMSVITLAQSNNRYIIKLMGGKITDTTTPLLKPWVYIVGDQEDGTYWKVTASGNNIGLDPSWATVGGGRAGMQNIYLGAGTNLNLDFFSIGPNTGTPSAEIDLADLYITGNFTFNGRVPDIDFFQGKGLFVFGNANFDSTQSLCNGCVFEGTVNLTSNQAGSNSTFNSGVFQGPVVLSGANANLEQVTGCPMFSTVSVTGAGNVLTADIISLPTFANQTLASGGTITLLGDSHNAVYTPTDTSKWASTPPSTVQQALDRIAAVVGATNAIP
jgi:hypothetical protein